MATADETDGKKLATMLTGSEEVYRLICFPCHRDDTTMPASGYCIDCQEHLCLNCFKHHKKATPCRHHTLLDKDAMPATQLLDPDAISSTPQPTNTSTQEVTSDNLATPCPHHKTEMLKFFCCDHQSLLCSICVAESHTNNCSVEYIPHGVNIDRRFYIHTVTRIDQLLKKFTSLNYETSTNVINSNESLRNALLDIKNYRQEMNDRIDALEKEIEKRVLALQYQNDERLKAIETTCIDVTRTLNAMNDSMKEFDTSDQVYRLFVEVIQASRQLSDYEDQIISLSAGDRIDEYQFTPSKAINDALMHERMIGELSIKLQEDTHIGSQYTPFAASANGSTNPTLLTPTLLDQICVKTSEDRFYCCISGIAALPSNRLVLTDYHNKSVKLVDVNKRSITSQLSLGIVDHDKPFDVTSTTNKQVAVTVPGRQRIQYISVSQKQLKMKHEIHTDGNCYGICCSQNKLIVTYENRNTVDILDMKGKVITRVRLPSTGKDIIHEPDNVQANSGGIYVSDHHYVIMLDWEGEIKGTFDGMELPTAITMLEDGSVLVCDSATGDLCQISPDGTYQGHVLRDLRSPNALCVNTGKHELYISRYTYGKTDIDNNVLVYKL